jgi:hypothetical protein
VLIIDSLVNAIREAKKYNSNTQIAPAAVLWTDKDRQWEAVINNIQRFLPELLILGSYAPDKMTGPVIWLKCVIARTLPTIFIPEDTIPIIYLPGVSRTDLRAIETCPLWLQGLAELQYRGVFWSQSNGRDWTVNAFLTSKLGGLNLDIAKDEKTQNALLRSLDTLLFEKKIDQLTGSHLESNDFNKMLMSTPDKDLLTWMNNPKTIKALWKGNQWDAFVELCTKEFNFNPDKEGDLGAAELLCNNKTTWVGVWQRFIETYHLYPKLPDLLAKVTYHHDLFVDQSTYLQYTIDQEKTLENSLIKLGEFTPENARQSILGLEITHANRRSWVWATMGYSPLVKALEHLTIIAELSLTIPAGFTPQEMSEHYQASYWRVDLACLEALKAVSLNKHHEIIKTVLGVIYTTWLTKLNHAFQLLIETEGYPGVQQVNKAIAEYGESGECVFFIDGLRFDIAHVLIDKLKARHFDIELSSNWSALPTVTSTAKAAVTPVHHLIGGRITDVDFQPSLKNEDKAYSQYHLKKLLNDEGWQFIASDETGDPTGKAWTECGDIDKEGHAKQLKLAQRFDPLLDEIVERIVELESVGWCHIRVVTDHGWLLVPDELPKVSLPKFATETRWGRCARLKESVSFDGLVVGWYWNSSVSIAMAPSISSFVAGRHYEHGGLSLQECITPVLHIKSHKSLLSHPSAVIKSKKWIGLVCKVQVTSDHKAYAVLRTKPADENSNICTMKPIVNGGCSLMVEDEDLEGSSVVLVLLDEVGQLMAKQATIVGE